jgi:hypothetical protein
MHAPLDAERWYGGSSKRWFDSLHLGYGDWLFDGQGRATYKARRAAARACARAQYACGEGR